MKSLFTLIVLFYFNLLTAQVGYEITADPNNPKAKILTGTIDKYLLQKDIAFKWFASNQQLYQPDSAIVSSFAKIKAAKLQLIVFAGTWCEDSQFILPRFFKLQEIAGVPDENITFFGVNRKKVALGHITEALGILYVQTIIVLRDGKELGRVVEYGNSGKWDKELAEIIKNN